MKQVKNDTYWLEKIKNDCNIIINETTNISLEEFYGSIVIQDSVFFRLIQISESSKKLSEEYKCSHNNISWTLISGLRNRVVHDYGTVDLDIIYSTAREDVPDMLSKL